jgi:hypothetical protein
VLGICVRGAYPAAAAPSKDLGKLIASLAQKNRTTIRARAIRVAPDWSKGGNE